MLGFGNNARSGDHTGLAGIDGGLAIARVSPGSDGRPVLSACLALAAETEQDSNTASALVARADAKNTAACGVMSPDQYRLLLVEAPDMPPAEQRAAVRWRIRDLVDFPVDNAVVDVFDIPEQARRGQTPMMYAVASPAAAVATQAGLIGRSGLKLKALDIPELCLRNVANMLPQDPAGVALLYLAEDHGILTLSRQGVLYLVRRLEVGLADLRATVTGDELTTDAFSSVALEVQRSLDYFESHYDQRPVNQVVLAPSDQAAGVAGYLGQQLGVACHQLDLNALLSPPEPVDESMQARCLLAVGAALRPAAAARRAAA